MNRTINRNQYSIVLVCHIFIGNPLRHSIEEIRNIIIGNGNGSENGNGNGNGNENSMRQNAFS